MEGKGQSRALRLFNNGCGDMLLSDHWLKIFANKNKPGTFQTVALPSISVGKDQTVMVCDPDIQGAIGWAKLTDEGGACDAFVDMGFNGDDTIELVTGW